MRHRSGLNNVLKPKLWLSLGLLALLIFLSSQLLASLKKKSSIDQEISALKEEASNAESQNSQFKKMIEYLESEQFAEEQAKLKLGLKKEGEQVAVITGLDEATSSQEVASSSDSSESINLINNWHRWFDYFLTNK